MPLPIAASRVTASIKILKAIQLLLKPALTRSYLFDCSVTCLLPGVEAALQTRDASETLGLECPHRTGVRLVPRSAAGGVDNNLGVEGDVEGAPGQLGL